MQIDSIGASKRVVGGGGSGGDGGCGGVDNGGAVADGNGDDGNASSVNNYLHVNTTLLILITTITKATATTNIIYNFLVEFFVAVVCLV